MGGGRARRTVAAVADAVPGLRATADDADRLFYARDLWPRKHLDVRRGLPAEALPAGVVWPSSTEDVARVLAWASAEGVPVVPFGAGSGVCAAVAPDERTLVLDLKRMGRIRRIDASAPAVEVEAGHLGNTLEDTLGRAGFTLGHFPSSILCSTAGGWVATRSGGQCSSAYGKIEDMVAELECVTGDGRVHSLRSRTQGADLVPLVVGSEGTLAVVTKATFRLHPAPARRAFGAWSYGSVEEGIGALRRLMQRGLRPAVARLYDPFDAMLARRAHPAPQSSPPRRRGSAFRDRALRSLLAHPATVNRGLGSRLGARLLGGALLVVVFEGQGARPHDELAAARAHAGGSWVGEGPARHWFERRYSVSWRQAGVFAAGGFVDTIEVAAPWSRIAALYDRVRRALGEHAFVMAHFSHAYPDGCCIYFSFAGAADGGSVRALGWDRACAATYDRAWGAAIAATIEAGGTVSHHHGIGRAKAAQARAELGAETAVLADVARAFDPAGVLNPGNLGLAKDGRAADTRQSHAAAAVGARSEASATSIDRESQLISAAGGAALRDVERAANAGGLTLGVEGVETRGEITVSAWLSEGAPGARDRWLDPADHLVAGIEAHLADGRAIRVRAAPRRAMGPDLSALFIGAGGRFGAVDRAWLRVGAAGTSPPSAAPFAWERDPPPNDGERDLLDAIARSLGR
jgi:alkyldihydroxyacetonephosphate synthase